MDIAPTILDQNETYKKRLKDSSFDARNKKRFAFELTNLLRYLETLDGEFENFQIYPHKAWRLAQVAKTHYFDDDTMRFFNGRVNHLYAGCVLVDSIKNPFGDPREYRVSVMVRRGDRTTVQKVFVTENLKKAEKVAEWTARMVRDIR